MYIVDPEIFSRVVVGAVGMGGGLVCQGVSEDYFG